jgi:hypothetical protein
MDVESYEPKNPKLFIFKIFKILSKVYLGQVFQNTNFGGQLN